MIIEKVAPTVDFKKKWKLNEIKRFKEPLVTNHNKYIPSFQLGFQFLRYPQQLQNIA